MDLRKLFGLGGKEKGLVEFQGEIGEIEKIDFSWWWEKRKRKRKKEVSVWEVYERGNREGGIVIESDRERGLVNLLWIDFKFYRKRQKKGDKGKEM